MRKRITISENRNTSALTMSKVRRHVSLDIYLGFLRHRFTTHGSLNLLLYEDNAHQTRNEKWAKNRKHNKANLLGWWIILDFNLPADIGRFHESGNLFFLGSKSFTFCQSLHGFVEVVSTNELKLKPTVHNLLNMRFFEKSFPVKES